jgi:hypothetical protein
MLETLPHIECRTLKSSIIADDAFYIIKHIFSGRTKGSFAAS